MIRDYEILTEADKNLNALYLQLDDLQLAKLIDFSSCDCKRIFPLTDESLAGVCILSMIGYCLYYNDKDKLKDKDVRDMLVSILAADIDLRPAIMSHPDLLIRAYLIHWEPFIRKVLRLRNELGLSECYYDSLVDNITCRAPRIRQHYGAVKLDAVYSSF